MFSVAVIQKETIVLKWYILGGKDTYICLSAVLEYIQMHRFGQYCIAGIWAYVSHENHVIVILRRKYAHVTPLQYKNRRHCNIKH